MKANLKSVAAIIVGFLTVAVLSVLTDFILEQTGIFPSYTSQISAGSSVWVLALALIYRSIYAVLGGFVAAKLSPKPMRDVKILAVLGTIGGIAGVIGGWSYGNQWYPIALAATAYPLVWYGGKLAAK